jgi:hypothetical protein
MLLSLRLRSASALLLFGGCRPLALTCISESEPDDCLMRGRRLRGFGGTLCDVCVAAGLAEVRAIVGGVPCGIHSSERSSSHGCVVLAMVVTQAVSRRVVENVIEACDGGGNAFEELL